VVVFFRVVRVVLLLRIWLRVVVSVGMLFGLISVRGWCLWGVVFC